VREGQLAWVEGSSVMSSKAISPAKPLPRVASKMSYKTEVMKIFTLFGFSQGYHHEYGLLTFILTPTAPTSFGLRRSVKKDDQVPE